MVTPNANPRGYRARRGTIEAKNRGEDGGGMFCVAPGKMEVGLGIKRVPGARVEVRG